MADENENLITIDEKEGLEAELKKLVETSVQKLLKNSALRGHTVI